MHLHYESALSLTLEVGGRGEAQLGAHALCHAGVARVLMLLPALTLWSRSYPCAVEVARDDDANAPRLTGINAISLLSS